MLSKLPINKSDLAFVVVLEVKKTGSLSIPRPARNDFRAFN